MKFWRKAPVALAHRRRPGVAEAKEARRVAVEFQFTTAVVAF